jgi:tetratricopeptide (TPR) repeat protein
MNTKNHIGLGHHSMAFALYHLYRLEHDDALIHAKRALVFFRKAADRDDVVNALIHIAIIQISQGKRGFAEANLRKAEHMYEAIHCEYLKPLLMLGKSMLARAQGIEAGTKVFADALRTSKKMGTREITWQIQREVALYHRDRGELHKSLAFYKDAVETIKQITETIDEEELKMSYLEVPFRRRVFEEIKALKRDASKSR